MSISNHQACIDILKEELLPAMGCTEPIAVAYAAAKACDVLGRIPEKVVVEASDNIVKNVKSVVVPNTGNLMGIEASAAAGIVAGKADKLLEVISEISDEQRQAIKSFLENAEITVVRKGDGLPFDLVANVYHGEHSASVQISHYHTNIVLIKKNSDVVYENHNCDELVDVDHNLTDRSVLSVRTIFDFTENADLSDIYELIEQQIEYNSAIAEEGIKGNWGANIGSVLLDLWGSDIKVRAKAFASAGADARMSGCELPVMIVSGSGNQGITASIPVIEYAKELKVEREKLVKALVLSNLITIHQKTGIGRLSAYCGAVSAGVGAGAGIAYLYGGGFKEISHTIVNALAMASGIICDGAKPSCAGKIALAVEAGILGFSMYQKGQQFYGGDGIVRKGVENTIENIGRLGREGMRETDKEIIQMMLGS